MMKVSRALLSVSDKAGLVEFAAGLAALGIEIVSTGGTMKTLREAGLAVTYVSDVTGFPEIMDGRVKTLNPLIHGGILAIRSNPRHMAEMQANGIRPIDLVVVNLYPFRQTVRRPGVTLEDAVENIDIGGPAMIRAAAKNFRDVTVVVNPERYDRILAALRSQGEVPFEGRMELAREAFSHTAEYDGYISRFLSGQLGSEIFPPVIHGAWEKIQDLRYGENPHQQAAFYRDTASGGGGIANARQIHGKELSFNNIVDLEAAYAIVNDFAVPAAAIIKHTNPCGVGVGETPAQAYEEAFRADEVSAFGGIAGLNREVDGQTAGKMSRLFLEAVVAPAFSDEALAILTRKENLRLIAAEPPPREGLDVKTVSGGLLIQEKDTALAGRFQMKTMTRRAPTEEEWRALLFGWRVVKHVKSNAIVVSGAERTLGVGAGQMNRVGAANIALTQAGEAAKGAAMASDAFFPFRDTVDAAAKAGITAIIQPGGSVRDAESIAAADENGIAMVFTGVRHFRH